MLGLITLFSTQVLGGAVFAAEENGKELKTDGKLELVVPTEVDPGVEPPEQPEDGKDGEVEKVPGGTTPSGKVGPLYINFAPNLDFGVWGVGEKTEYFAKPQSWKDTEDGTVRERANFVQVTDLRGTSEGWGLSVTQEGEFKAGDKSLGKTEISFLNNVLASDMLADEEGKKQLPEAVVKADTTLAPEQTIELMKAAPTKGAGTWTMNFEKTLGQHDEKLEDAGKIPTGEDGQPVRTPNAIDGAIKLTIPKTSNKFAAAYSTKLVWSLTDKPGENIE